MAGGQVAELLEPVEHRSTRVALVVLPVVEDRWTVAMVILG
ncbi:hypothetical protein [Actinocrispum sp. NPDC049592]